MLASKIEALLVSVENSANDINSANNDPNDHKSSDNQDHTLCEHSHSQLNRNDRAIVDFAEGNRIKYHRNPEKSGSVVFTYDLLSNNQCNENKGNHDIDDILQTQSASSRYYELDRNTKTSPSSQQVSKSPAVQAADRLLENIQKYVALGQNFSSTSTTSFPNLHEYEVRAKNHQREMFAESRDRETLMRSSNAVLTPQKLSTITKTENIQTSHTLKSARHHQHEPESYADRNYNAVRSSSPEISATNEISHHDEHASSQVTSKDHAGLHKKQQKQHQHTIKSSHRNDDSDAVKMAWSWQRYAGHVETLFSYEKEENKLLRCILTTIVEQQVNVLKICCKKILDVTMQHIDHHDSHSYRQKSGYNRFGGDANSPHDQEKYYQRVLAKAFSKVDALDSERALLDRKMEALDLRRQEEEAKQQKHRMNESMIDPVPLTTIPTRTTVEESDFYDVPGDDKSPWHPTSGSKSRDWTFQDVTGSAMKNNALSERTTQHLKTLAKNAAYYPAPKKFKKNEYPETSEMSLIEVDKQSCFNTQSVGEDRKMVNMQQPRSSGNSNRSGSSLLRVARYPAAAPLSPTGMSREITGNNRARGGSRQQQRPWTMKYSPISTEQKMQLQQPEQPRQSASRPPSRSSRLSQQSHSSSVPRSCSSLVTDHHNNNHHMHSSRSSSNASRMLSPAQSVSGKGMPQNKHRTWGNASNQGGRPRGALHSMRSQSPQHVSCMGDDELLRAVESV